MKYPDIMTPEYCVGVLRLAKATAAEQMAAARHLNEALTDAARYRWLRHGDNDELCLGHLNMDDAPDDGFFLLRNDRLDSAIDTAMAAPIGEK